MQVTGCPQRTRPGLVAAGVGIAIVPEGVARAAADVALRPIDVDVKREVGIADNGKRPLSGDKSHYSPMYLPNPGLRAEL